MSAGARFFTSAAVTLPLDEAPGSNYESTVSLLAVDQCAENLPAALDVASIRSAMRLANRIFARDRVNMSRLGSREIPAIVNYTN